MKLVNQSRGCRQTAEASALRTREATPAQGDCEPTCYKLEARLRNPPKDCFGRAAISLAADGVDAGHITICKAKEEECESLFDVVDSGKDCRPLIRSSVPQGRGSFEVSTSRGAHEIPNKANIGAGPAVAIPTRKLDTQSQSKKATARIQALFELVLAPPPPGSENVCVSHGNDGGDASRCF